MSQMPGWSSGLGRCPLTAVTGGRLPYQVPKKRMPTGHPFFCHLFEESNPVRATAVKKTPTAWRF